MPLFTQKLSDLEDIGPVIELILAPSLRLLRTTAVSPSSMQQVKVVAMIDTGASGSLIKQGIAELLGIYPIGNTYLNTPSSTNVHCSQFHVQMVFPNDVIIQSMVVTEAPLQNQHIQCLIGRDVLQHGLFIYNGSDNSFTLSF